MSRQKVAADIILFIDRKYFLLVLFIFQEKTGGMSLPALNLRSCGC